MPNQILPFKPCRYLQLLFNLQIGASIIAVLVLWIAGFLAWYWSLLLLILLSFAWHHCFARYIWHSHPNAILKLVWRVEKDKWLLYTQSGQCLMAQLNCNYLLTPWLMLLNFKVAGIKKPITVVVTKQNVTDNAARHFYVALKYNNSRLS